MIHHTTTNKNPSKRRRRRKKKTFPPFQHLKHFKKTKTVRTKNVAKGISAPLNDVTLPTPFGWTFHYVCIHQCVWYSYRKCTYVCLCVLRHVQTYRSSQLTVVLWKKNWRKSSAWVLRDPPSLPYWFHKTWRLLVSIWQPAISPLQVHWCSPCTY